MANERYNLRPRPVRIIYREVDEGIQQRGIPVMNQEQHRVDAQGQEQGNEANVNDQEEANEVIQQAMAANNMFTLAFWPPQFDGSSPEIAGRWLKNFNRYADLAGAAGEQRCNLFSLMLSGSCETWFNQLALPIRTNYEALEQAFRERYINAAHTRIRRQMETLARSQKSGESVDVYFTEARSKMADQNYDEALQITLLLNGLRTDLKGLVMQHLPFQNLDELLEKCRHIEASLNTNPYNPYMGNVTLPMVANATKEEMFATTGDIEKVEKAVGELAKKIDEVRITTQPRNETDRRGNNRQVLRCYVCGSTAHFAKDCTFNRQDREETGYPPRTSSFQRPRGIPRGRGAPRGRGHGSGWPTRNRSPERWQRPRGRTRPFTPGRSWRNNQGN